jgi:hypothetical protein
LRKNWTTHRQQLKEEESVMRRKVNLASRLVSLLLLISITTLPVFGRPRPAIPNPALFLSTVEYYSTGGTEYIRYRYQVANNEDFPDAMFAAAPSLPPCGANPNSARSWVDFYDQRGKRLYGFCALGKNDDLNAIWFALPSDAVPPSYVYIEITDRQTNTKYKSNLADTTL